MLSKKIAGLTIICIFLAGLLLSISSSVQADHETHYSCENACVVVIDPKTGGLSISDCCGGFVRLQIKKHTRYFDEK